MVRTINNAHEFKDYIKYWSKFVDDVRISDVMDRGQGSVLLVGDLITVGRTRCPQPFHRLVVTRDGRVSPCCADRNQEFIVGDVYRNKLSEIWKNKKMNSIRRIQRKNEHNRIKICKHYCVKESYVWEKSKKKY